ncbi:hypothetical protein ACIG87_02715 [Micromonospora sp. NPDC051925]|uniref:hypothetical protein n=1 Tax=Micromonospora sp. NPDC051925 TaxID=3364288 RepID=UPI0037C56C42
MVAVVVGADTPEPVAVQGKDAEPRYEVVLSQSRVVGPEGVKLAGWSVLLPAGPPEAIMGDVDRWRAAERRRRGLAERLAWDLAHPNPDASRSALGDFVAATAMRVRWASAIDAHTAFDHASRVIALGGEFGRVEGRGGVIVYVHCLEGGVDDWSLVVPYEPFIGPVLVCVDDLDDHCMWISEDDPQAREALERLRTEMELAFATRATLIANGSLPPD